jgi:hypothetical protein
MDVLGVLDALKRDFDYDASRASAQERTNVRLLLTQKIMV